MKLKADCPSCGAGITFWTTFRAANPFSFKCTKCNLRLPEESCRISAPLWGVILAYGCIGAVFGHLKWHYGIGGVAFGALFFLLWFTIEASATLSSIEANSLNDRIKIRGWLLIFCFLSMSFLPVKTLYDLTGLLIAFSKLPDSTSGQIGVVATVAVLGLLISALGIYCGISISKRTQNAVRIANIFLVVTLLGSFAASLSPAIFVPKIELSGLIKVNASYFSQRLIFTLTWLLYFAKSRRVKETFLTEKAPSNTRSDHDPA
jgi:hypothetical protein